jgi:acyl-CoA reductase-like NAD-dependent aldehyde dehydrogenase
MAERAARLGEAIAVLRAHADELGILDAVDSGNPASAMIGEVDLACEWLEWCRGVAARVVGDTLPAPRGHWLLTRREPYGVVVRITAYNHPILFAAQKIGAPLMTGNTVILKIPQQTPLAPLRMGELLREVLPPGVLNIVTGAGSVAGDALVRHPDVKRISLIGGVRTGQQIQIAAAESGIKHVSLELGGKNPMIVLPDVDPERAAQAAVRGMNFLKTQGQSCGSCSRLFVHSSMADAVTDRIAELCAEIRVGDPLDPETQMGCMVSAREQARVLGMIEDAKGDGARLVCGGGVPAGFEGGAFVAPTVFDEVTMDMRLGREEVFGPVLSVLRYDDPETAFADADALPLGLTASVWTNDLGAAFDLAERLDTGYVWINGAAQHFTGAPFSGHRDSGTDSEEGIEELYSFTQTKTVSIARGA